MDLAHLKETAGTMEDEIMGTVIGSVEVIVIVLTGMYICCIYGFCFVTPTVPTLQCVERFHRYRYNEKKYYS